jgi:hypothetical protein
MRLEQEEVRQTSACSRARSAPTLAVGSMPEPHTAGEMVLAVFYLFAHLIGDARCQGSTSWKCSTNRVLILLRQPYTNVREA